MYTVNVVKATSLDTNEDIVYAFSYLADAEQTLAEFQQDAGLTGEVLYAGAEINDTIFPKFKHSLYGSAETRYIKNLHK
tara:strand:- start:141 stop:377 length:237 start_codon:yes stop_codon:yes gene_type:complete